MPVGKAEVKEAGERGRSESHVLGGDGHIHPFDQCEESGRASVVTQDRSAPCQLNRGFQWRNRNSNAMAKEATKSKV